MGRVKEGGNISDFLQSKEGRGSWEKRVERKEDWREAGPGGARKLASLLASLVVPSPGEGKKRKEKRGGEKRREESETAK